MSETDDMAEYRAHLEGVTTAWAADEEVKDRRVRLAVMERVGIAMRETHGDTSFDGLGALHARLRLAERHAKALAARLSHVPVAGGPNGGGSKKRGKGARNGE